MRNPFVRAIGCIALASACAQDPPPTFDEDAEAQDAPAVDDAPDAAPPDDAPPPDTSPPDATPDAHTDAAPDVPLDAAPDAAPDVAPDAALDVAPAVAPDALPDAALDRPLDATPDVPPLDATPDVTGDVGPVTEGTWSTNATAHDCAAPGVVGSRFAYRCPAGGAAASLWGTGVYTHDSSICTAAVHAGRITAAAGGVVTVEMRAGLASYAGSTRNGVSSGAYGAWGCSFAVVAPPCAAPAVECGGACAALATDALHCGSCGNACPSGQSCLAGACVAVITWGTNAADRDCATPGVVGSRFTYTCPAGGVPALAWGTDVYTHDSSICTAAVHAGRITLAGGAVTLQMAAGLASYVGSTRNGVTTREYGAWGCSFTFP